MSHQHHHHHRTNGHSKSLQQNDDDDANDDDVIHENGKMVDVDMDHNAADQESHLRPLIVKTTSTPLSPFRHTDDKDDDDGVDHHMHVNHHHHHQQPSHLSQQYHRVVSSTLSFNNIWNMMNKNVQSIISYIIMSFLFMFIMCLILFIFHWSYNIPWNQSLLTIIHESLLAHAAKTNDSTVIHAVSPYDDMMINMSKSHHYINTHPPRSLLSDSRGHIAILYSGTVRTFTQVFHSHLMHLLIPSPYTIHIYAHISTGRFDWKSPAAEHPHTSIVDGFENTFQYYEQYMNLDGQVIHLMNDVVRWIHIDDEPLDMNLKDEFNYTEIFSVIGDRHHFASKLMSVAAQCDSLRRANEARLQYAQQYGIDYTWVIRLRCDHLMRSNLWDDIFNIAPFNSKNKDHQRIITAAASRASTSVWNGGLLYDMIYMPRAYLDISSPEHNHHLAVPTSDWYSLPPDTPYHVLGTTDQFAFGSSYVMTLYCTRFNLSFITYLAAHNPEWILWAEPLLRQSMEENSIHVIPVMHTYSIARMLHTEFSLYTAMYTASRCVWLDYGKETYEFCPHWLSLQENRTRHMMQASQQNDQIMMHKEQYVNQGDNAKQSFQTYMVSLYTHYKKLNIPLSSTSTTSTASASSSSTTSASASTSSVASVSKFVTAMSNMSNFYYFWRYRSIQQHLSCEWPTHGVLSPLDAMPNVIQLHDTTSITIASTSTGDSHSWDPFFHHYYPFMMYSSSSAVKRRYMQHLVCQFE